MASSIIPGRQMITSVIVIVLTTCLTISTIFVVHTPFLVSLDEKTRVAHGLAIRLAGIAMGGAPGWLLEGILPQDNMAEQGCNGIGLVLHWLAFRGSL
ncbi:MAG: hypothetical protein ACYSUP_05505 [Planctomycetota bacterium]|jgi:hypothetical protein